MNYYDENPYQIEWDTEYVREIYWESKGLGKATVEPVAVANPVFPKYPCSKCGRMGTKAMLKVHNEKHPNCDQ